MRYVTYAEALERGELRERARRSSGANALSPWLSGSTLREGFINRLRRREWLFREPFRFFEVKSGAFDLIHCHSYSVRLTGADVPLIVTNSAPAEWLYKDGLQLSFAHIAWARVVDRALATATGVEHISYRLPNATRLVRRSEYLRAWYVERRVMAKDSVDVVPPSVDVPAEARALPPQPYRVGFIGDFDVKGGDVALAAFRLVNRERPDTRMSVIGCEPRSLAKPALNHAIEWVGRVEHGRLLNELLPTIDVLAYLVYSDLTGFLSHS